MKHKHGEREQALWRPAVMQAGSRISVCRLGQGPRRGQDRSMARRVQPRPKIRQFHEVRSSFRNTRHLRSIRHWRTILARPSVPGSWRRLNRAANGTTNGTTNGHIWGYLRFRVVLLAWRSFLYERWACVRKIPRRSGKRFRRSQCEGHGFKSRHLHFHLAISGVCHYSQVLPGVGQNE